MSALLESAAQLDPERSAALAANDALMRRSVRRPAWWRRLVAAVWHWL